MDIDWEVLTHPSYYPDLAHTDYYLFLALQNSFARKVYDYMEAVKTTVEQHFFDFKTLDFYHRRIHLLPERRQEVIS